MEIKITITPSSSEYEMRDGSDILLETTYMDGTGHGRGNTCLPTKMLKLAPKVQKYTKDLFRAIKGSQKRPNGRTGFQG